MELYPSWRYHRTEPARIVDTPEEDSELGEGWADTPAAFFEETPGEEPADEPADEPAEEPCSSKKTKTTKKRN